MQTILSSRIPLAILIALSILAMPRPGVAETPTESNTAKNHDYVIDSDESWLHVLVYRGGLLSGLGHNHVVSHNDISGDASFGSDITAGRFLLMMTVADFLVDDTNARVSAGEDFPGEISAKDVAGTRKNMLGRKLLDADNFPTIQIRSVGVSGALPEVQFATIISLRGREMSLNLPANIVVADGSFVASGEFSVTHRELGLSPFKAALGALRVRDELIIQYRIVGSRLSEGAE